MKLNNRKVKDYADMWHFVMDAIIDVESGKVDHLDATQIIMDKFEELLENNGMSINDIPTVYSGVPTNEVNL